MTKLTQTRYPEIDLVRGVALLGMAVYHEVQIATVIVTGQFWQATGLPRMFGWLVALTFLFVFGMSAHIKYQRLLQKKLPFFQIYAQFFRRAVVIALSAGIVSFVSWSFLPDHWIRMGVIHFFALATLLMPLVLESRRKLLLAGVLVFGLWLSLRVIDLSAVTSYWLLPLGVYPSTYATLDHWPLIPFLLVPIAGALFASWYVPNRSEWISRTVAAYRLTAPIVWIGRHSLLAYLLHVPLLAVMTWLLYRLVLLLFPA